MDYKETSNIESFVAKTPFHMETGWELVLENSNKNCSHSEIELLLQKRIINLIDIEIMKILVRYPYTNSGNIAFLLNHTLHQVYQKLSYLNNLNKLKKAGLSSAMSLLTLQNKPRKWMPQPHRCVCTVYPRQRIHIWHLLPLTATMQSLSLFLRSVNWSLHH